MGDWGILRRAKKEEAANAKQTSERTERASASVWWPNMRKCELRSKAARESRR